MDIGILPEFRNPAQWATPIEQIYREGIEKAVLAERLRFDHFWTSEHHFAVDSWSPSLLTILAAAAARTSRIRLGTFIIILPFHQPWRIAEDATAVDLISGGRLDLGVGPGWDLNEFESLGVPIKQRRPRMHEGLEALRRLFTEERLTHNGKYYRFSNVTLTPKPLQKPHPPLWVAAIGEQAIQQAARLGYNLMGAGSEHGQKIYDDALREAGREPGHYNIAQLRIAYVARTRQQAWDEAEPHVHYGLNYFYTRFKAMADRFTQQATLPEVPPVGRLRDTRGLSFFGARVTVGTPGEVTEEILRYKANTRITHMVLMELPGIAAEKNNRNLELFAKEVMPHIR